MRNVDKRRKAGVVILGAAMFALMYGFGYRIDHDETCSIEKALGLALMLWPFFVAVLAILLRIGRRADESKPGRKGFVLRAFWLILLCYLPYFVIMFPGSFAYDAGNQFFEIETGEYTAYHPLAHTLLLQLCVRLRPVFKSLNKCAALYSAIQMTSLAALFALTCASIDRTCGRKTARLSVLFFALYPSHMCFAVNATKDVIFSGAFVLVFALCAEAFSKEKTDKRLCRGILAAGFLAALFRHNMLCILVWAIPVLLASRSRVRRTTALCLMIATVLGVGTNSLLAKALDAQSGSIKEMLSVPVQQLGRARVKSPEKFSQDELQAMDELFLHGSYMMYKPSISDNLKSRLEEEPLRRNPKRYIDLYFSVGKKCPQEYLDAALALMYPFLYPYEEYKVIRDYIEVGIETGSIELTYGKGAMKTFEQFEGIRSWLEENIWNTGANDIPVIRWIFNLGVIVWVMLLCLLREIYAGRSSRAIVYLIPVMLWAFYLVGPVMQGRYIYPIVCCLPVLASCPKQQRIAA